MYQDYIYIARKWGVCEPPRCRSTMDEHTSIDSTNGAQAQQSCTLPFTDKGLTYTDCKQDKKGAWCPTGPEWQTKTTRVKYWEKKTKFKMCIFPFNYWGNKNSCVTRWFKAGKWCAIRKWWWGGVRKWGQCKKDGVTSKKSYTTWTRKTLVKPGFGWGRCAPGNK